jgi:hypothetical protein
MMTTHGRDEQFTTPDHKSKPFIRIWAPEILSIILSVSLVAATIAILKVYDGKPQPDLGSNLSLNGLLQFIITIAQFSFSYSLARGLGQLKWLWYLPQDTRPLRHFEAYDEACRSSLEAFS